jgi:hypothetical protein
MQNGWMLRAVMAVAMGCLAAGATTGCMLQTGGTEVVVVGPAPMRNDGTHDASVMVIDVAALPEAGGDGPAVPDTSTPPARLTLGQACAQADQCTSGFCVDSICCDSACAGVCQSCDLNGKRGTCAAVTGAPAPGRGSCMGAGTPCAGSCDGSSSVCRYPGNDVTCAPARCSDGMAQARSVCSGTGTCVAGTAISCAPFTCDGAACAGGCGPSRPCLAGHHCSGGRCFPLRENGGICDAADQCASGWCVDGRCCVAPACGVCAACVGKGGTCQMVVSAPDPDTCMGSEACGADGQCRKLNGQMCAGNQTCLSGFCVAGRCCNTACQSPCDSCVLPGSVGTCRPLPVDTDVKNCGRCGNVCSGDHITASCSQGMCGGTCHLGFTDCNANLGADGCEVNTATDANNCGACNVRCPGTGCTAGVCEKIDFAWSSSGPLPGQSCLLVSETADPFGWNDNHLCTQRDFGLKWSSSGPITGMICTQWLEPLDPFTWNDNYLCAPVDYGLRWSNNGPLPGLRCTPITEPADLNGWNDNFICVP